ncbi:hypothetical protein [Methylocella sp.]|uniref:hypothetical protein n=1 Tax=Methylocella sp. TaxID=1978226 RepID=UPI003783095A
MRSKISSAAEGEYSVHKHTELLDLAGQPLPPFMVRREWGYVVNRGQTLQAEFTFENGGKSTQTVPVGWMLSTNDYISKTDRTLAYGYMTLARDRVDTRLKTLVIPKDIAPGQYWLGAIVDIDGKVPADTLRDNNATYIPIQVQ